MAAQRCTTCDLNYPVAKAYELCPLCKQGTYTADEKPMGVGEARDCIREVHAFEENLVREFQAVLAKLPETAARPSFTGVE